MRFREIIQETSYPSVATPDELIEIARRIHHTPQDLSDGDLSERIWAYNSYKLSRLAVSSLDLSEWSIDDELVAEYVARIRAGEEPPPIIYDRTLKSIIDGTHRANAVDQAGGQWIMAYVGQGRRNEDEVLDEGHHAYDEMKWDTKFEPLKAGDTVRVYHGFRDLPDALTTCLYGLSGKSRAARVYSYEADNNPHGLFVTMARKTAENFGTTVVEFVARSEELEAPVWPGENGGFTGYGGYSKYFGHGREGRAARNQRRKQARGEAIKSATVNGQDHILQSDDPLTAHSLMAAGETQALFIGDLNPERITAVWTYEQMDGKWQWLKHTRETFVSRHPEPKWSPERNQRDRVFKPEERFDGERFIAGVNARYGGGGKRDMENSIRNVWFMCLGSKTNKAREFIQNFGSFLWPNQYRDAMTWMYRRWGTKE